MFLGRVVGPGEPEWLADDTAKALAFEAAQRQACDRCSTRTEQWFDDEGLPLDPPPFMATVRHCEACAEKERLMLDMHADAARRGDDAETTARAMAGISVVLAPFEATVEEEED